MKSKFKINNKFIKIKDFNKEIDNYFSLFIKIRHFIVILTIFVDQICVPISQMVLELHFADFQTYSLFHRFSKKRDYKEI